MKATRVNKKPRAEVNRQRRNPLSIKGRDTLFDYSFRSRRAMEESGGVSYDDWEVVDKSNNVGETWAENKDLAKLRTRAHGKNAFVYQDTILCKRHKAFGKAIREDEDDKYNSQIAALQNYTKNSRFKLRSDLESAGRGYTGTVGGKGIQGGFKQRPGPTEKE